MSWNENFAFDIRLKEVAKHSVYKGNGGDQDDKKHIPKPGDDFD